MVSGPAAIAVALLIDLALGDPPNRFHPVAAMGSLIRWLTAHWNHGSCVRRLFTGAELVLLGGALFSLPWLMLGVWIRGQPFWIQVVLLGILLKPVVSFRALFSAGREIQQALQNGDLEEGRLLAAWHLVSRDTSSLSGQEVASAAIESIAENLTDSFLAPLMCFALGGLPLAWAYRFVNTCDAMIGYCTEEFEHFGKFAAGLDDVLNWFPARIGGLAIVLAAALPGYSMPGAWRMMWAQHNQTASPNAGWTMAAAAGALGVALEKKGAYRLEGGPSLPEVEDISRADRLVAIAQGFCALLCLLIVQGVRSWS